MSTVSKNDLAWQTVFDELKLLTKIEEQGYAYVTALELKKVGRREPRLMAKQDTLSSRPDIFKQHKLSIFPVENGHYIIFSDPEHKSYFSLDAGLDWIPRESYYPKNLDLRSFDSYPKNQQFSESQAIDFAFTASLLQHFLKDDLLHLTIRGRLRSGSFSFSLPENGKAVPVNGVQIEVDSGYESPGCLYLLEAKVGKRDDFHIRQLFYPWLEWSQKTGKPVVPILLLYSNSQYYLLQFQFSSTFGDLQIVKSMNYTLNEDPRAGLDFSQLFRDVPVESEPDVPYPQADDLDKVVDVVQRIHSGSQTKNEVAEYFEFDERQGDYYLNAAAYLGFVERNEQYFELTDSGKVFIRSHLRADKTRLTIVQLLKRPSFRDMLERLLNGPTNPDLFGRQYSIQDLPTQEIVQIIQRHTELNENTAARRAHTAKSWIKWVLRNAELARP